MNVVIQHLILVENLNSNTQGKTVHHPSNMKTGFVGFPVKKSGEWKKL